MLTLVGIDHFQIVGRIPVFDMAHVGRQDRQCVLRRPVPGLDFQQRIDRK
jgi:hypothetical protein